MKKTFATALILTSILTTGAQADTSHLVIPGDTMWKISLSYDRILEAIVSANSHITNPDLIYPGQLVTIPATGEDIQDFEREVIDLVNEIRKSYGLGVLKADEDLCRVARLKSRDMADKNYFSHTSPTYGSPFDMMKDMGISYNTAAENIAMGQRSPESVVNDWMDSPGHRENILGKSYTHIGVGYVKKGNIWTQMFVGR